MAQSKRFLLSALVKRILWLIGVILTIPVTLVLYNLLRGGVVYKNDLLMSMTQIPLKMGFTVLPLVASLWVFNDSYKRDIKHRWLWIIGTLFLTVVFLPIYLIYRIKYKLSSKKTKFTKFSKGKLIIIGLFLVPSFILSIFVVLVGPSLLLGKRINPLKFYREAQESRQRWTIKPPFPSTTYLGKPYALRECFNRVPENFRFYRKHVHGWKVYISKVTPGFQETKEPFPEIVLESPGLWICRYLSGEEDVVKWQTYHDSQYKYSIQHPPYWSLRSEGNGVIILQPELLKVGDFPYNQDYRIRIEMTECALSAEQVLRNKYADVMDGLEPKNDFQIKIADLWMWTVFEDGTYSSHKDKGIYLATFKQGNLVYFFQLGPFIPDNADYDSRLSSVYRKVLESFNLVTN